MQDNVQPLMRRAYPLPDESLVSLLVRLTERNSYEALSLLKGLIFESPKSLRPLRDNLEFPLNPSTYEQLTFLTQIEALKLYQCTPHRFAPILTPPSQKTLYAQLLQGDLVPVLPKGQYPKQLRPPSATQFCPRCLEEKRHYTLRWTPIAVSACLKHECLLVSYCHECKNEISTIAIAKARCDRCQADLSTAKTHSIHQDALGKFTQNIIQSWFMEYTTPISDILVLPQQSVRILYWVVEELQLFLRTVKDSNWTYIHSLVGHEEHPEAYRSVEDNQLPSPYESYRLYTTACKSILHWPENFFNLLDQYRNRNTLSQYRTFQGSQLERKGKLIPGIIAANLGPLYTQWLPSRWKHQEYAFLREAFNSYIADNYWFSDMSELKSFCNRNPELADRCMYASLADAVELLDLPSETIEFIVGSDQMRERSVQEDSIKYIKREAVFALRDAQEKPITLQGVVIRLGLSTNVLKDLVKVGLFSDGERSKGYFTIEDLTSIGEFLFQRKISQCIELLPEDPDKRKDYVSLQEAEHLLSVADLNIVTIFLLLAAGNLSAYAQSERSSRLTHLHFLQKDIQVLATSYTTKKVFLLGEEKVASILGIKGEILEQWTKKALLTPEAMYGRKLFFTSDRIDEFKHKHLFGAGSIKLLGLSTRVFAGTIWSSPISLEKVCVKGFDLCKGDACIFDKEMLTRWREDWLTIDEGASILGISETTLHEWIKAKKILQIDFINDMPTWVLKHEIVRFAKVTSQSNDEEYP